MEEPIDLRPIELVIALDIMEQIRKTSQVYIVGHDVPVSISKPVFDYLDAKRKEISSELKVPEAELEFEDAIAILCGFYDLGKSRASGENLRRAQIQIAKELKK